MSLVDFYPGDGSVVAIEVDHISEFPRNKEGTCAFCHGDPLGEKDLNSLIGKFMQQNRWADTCPCCQGKPT